MNKYMITGALSATLLALSACGQSDYSTDAAVNDVEPAMNETADGTDYAANDPAVNQAEPTAVSDIDGVDVRGAQVFVNQASQAVMANIETSKIALEKAETDEVKAYAQMIVDDHKAASQALKLAMTSTPLMTPSATLDEFHQRRVDDITEEAQGDAPAEGDIGSEWDHDYIAMQIDMQQDAIDLFEDYAKNGNLVEVQQFAQATLPTLQAHLERAREIEGMVDDNNIVTPQ